MDIKTYQTYDAIGLAELVKNRQVSALELLDVSFARLEQANPRLNAVLRTRKENVYQEVEKTTKQNQPFYGVPILLKDISQAIRGEVLSSGSKLLKDNIAKTDSNLVAKLRASGFQFLGHTNTPEFGLKNVTEPKSYKPTRNPWKLDHSPGGSSGGAAAAVASGMVPVAGASDGGGSIRIPAAFTGLFGLKPTRGRTPVGPGVGRQWQGASIDFALTRSVRDSAALLDVLQTIQPEAAFQTPLYEASYLDLVNSVLKRKFRIAFSTASPVGTPVSQDAETAVHQVVCWLEKQGHVVEEMESPVDGINLMKNYYAMNSGEINRVINNLEKAFNRELTLADMEIVTWVLHKSGENLSAAAYSESLAGWDIAAAEMARFHQKYDLYVTPTNAYPAPKIGELTQTETEIEKLKTIDKLTVLEQQKLVYEMFLPSLTYTPHTQLANLTGQPAMSVPTYLTKERLPMGVQFLAPKGKEGWLLEIARSLEQSGLWIDIMNNPFNNNPNK
ncbi:amidase [Paraliobacillus quinghaiensis]|uniref:Amidase n=1 Tax=Paraliobacillus quinghaiensis TaxID=470815 RepID=A0A917WXD0_9BACI|nr:amidase [Paraliobacillus quinghaiensis]GGM41908.1 amidase [Paraliobacillus quinghaiensis]